MSTTNLLTLNIAAVPLLWILPLAFYLISYILAFSGSRYYPRNAFGQFLWISLIGIYILLPGEVSPEAILIDVSMSTKVFLLLLALFVCCMVCHGEVYRLRPASAQLTQYYLFISLGGAMGGVSVALIAPSVFLLFQEIQLGLLACGALYVATHFINKEETDVKGLATLIRMGMVTALIAMIGASFWLWQLQLTNAIVTKRNFFGLIRVRESDPTGGQTSHRTLLHGSTIHGLQFTESERLRRFPTFYYGPITGIGIALKQPHGNRRVGVVGMGSATLAAYGEDGDYFRFYEIDPDMVATAKSEFTFLADSQARCDVAIGDARLSLEKEPDNEFDVLVLDAFSSDAIPVHLLTIEAMKIYDRHIHPEGMLAVHVTNRPAMATHRARRHGCF
jgi:tRNA A58 N-methylase Trm61